VFNVNIPLHQVNLTGSSPVQQLLQWDTGMEYFYYLAMDHPLQLQALLNAMQKVQIQRTHLACQFDVPVIYQAENTSTTMISPYYYEKYSLPQIHEQAQIVHQHGKKLVIHMCGLLYDLLELIKRTGLDGIHSVTPPPVGNTPFDAVYNCFGNNFPIQGRFGSTQWHGLEVDEIRANLRKILSYDLVQSRPFMLIVTADGLHVDYKEIKKIQYVVDEVNHAKQI
jgi:uroporphyrinogen-III decarboxylase